MPDEIVAPASTESVIEAAMVEAGIGDGLESAKPVAEEKPAEVSTDPEVLKQVAAREQELAEYGLEPEQKGKVNRIPQPRVVKMIEKAEAKLRADFEKEKSGWTTKSQEYDKALASKHEVDAMIVADPDKYLGMLAVLHPEKYQKYLTPKEKAVVKSAMDEVGEAPKPDRKFEDGSVGWSDEQLDRLMVWNRKVAKEEAKQELQQKFDDLNTKFDQVKPFITKDAEKKALDDLAQKFQSQLHRLGEQWGDDFKAEIAKDRDSDIFKYWNSHLKEGCTLEEATSAVLLPRLRSDKNKMREDLLKEQEERAKGASRGPAASTKSDKKAVDTPQSTEDTIWAALEEAGIASR